MKEITSLIILITSITLISCTIEEPSKIYDVRIFENTEAWDLAKAVKQENIRKIKKIIKKNPSVANVKDPIFGTTLLIWSVGTERYNSTKALLEMGVNPNMYDSDGSTALICASGYSWVDIYAKKDAKFVDLLLEYGSDPNLPYIGNSDFYIKGETPLMISAEINSVEKVKSLLRHGAHINAKTETGETAASRAINLFSIDAAYLLIVENHAQIIEP